MNKALLQTALTHCKKENTELRELVKVMGDALGFYGDKDRYSHAACDGEIFNYLITYDDYYMSNTYHHYVGGKRARQVTDSEAFKKFYKELKDDE